jgi:hypothetical protein
MPLLSLVLALMLLPPTRLLSLLFPRMLLPRMLLPPMPLLSLLFPRMLLPPVPLPLNRHKGFLATLHPQRLPRWRK